MTAKELREEKTKLKEKINRLEGLLEGLDFCIWKFPVNKDEPVQTECKGKIYLSDKNKPFDVCPFCGGETVYEEEC